jgi:Winged helix-turn helix
MKGRDSARVLRRALILGQLDRGQTAVGVADSAGVAPKTIRAIVRRCEEEGLAQALQEKPLPGRQRALNAGQSPRIVAMVCGPQPQGHPFGDGQSEFAQPQSGSGSLWTDRRQLVVESIHGPLHAQTRKLAKPGGDRDQPVQPPVRRSTKNSLPRPAVWRNQSLEPEDEPQPGHP